MLTASKHHCPGNIYYVDDFATLHPHHSNELRMLEKRDLKNDKNCSECYKIKLIYPKAVTARARNDLRKQSSIPANKADSVNIFAFLKNNRKPIPNKSRDKV